MAQAFISSIAALSVDGAGGNGSGGLTLDTCNPSGAVAGGGSSNESGAAEVFPAVEVIVGGVEAAAWIGGGDHGDVAEDEETL